MIQLFNIPNYTIDTSKYSNLLHDKVVNNFEDTISEYVGAKYSVTFNSATSAIFLMLQNKNATITVPSIIPPVVLNAIITSGNKHNFSDNTDWVGNSYVLHDFGDYKIIDSAQKLEKNQFNNECNHDDLLLFSFYPTKPIGSCDGGMVVSNDKHKIDYLKELSLNGMSYSENNWDRKIKFPGYKMYMNSIQCDIAIRNFNVYNDKLEKLEKIRSIYNKELGYQNNSNHLYRLEMDSRDEFINYMKNNGVICGIHYEASHLNPVYRIDGTEYPKSEIHSKKTVSIPFHENLTEKEISYIIDLIIKFKR